MAGAAVDAVSLGLFSTRGRRGDLKTKNCLEESQLDVLKTIPDAVKSLGGFRRSFMETVEVFENRGTFGVLTGSTGATKGLSEFQVVNSVAGTAKDKNHRGHRSQVTVSKLSSLAWNFWMLE